MLSKKNQGCINLAYSINCSNFQDGLSDGLNTGGHPLSYGGPPGGGPGGGDTRGGQCGVPGTSGPEQVPVDLSQQAHRPNGILHPDTSKFFSSVFLFRILQIVIEVITNFTMNAKFYL